ncbi:hypothetical protein JVX98_05835 (plasmid) [Ensifer sp. PDNC004]|nr:hypothetical protein [Ensifer sp. PDNC004]QRY65168.1 hypothetical protein JVX98_05835 [Ensifer sp. PDNC004]
MPRPAGCWIAERFGYSAFFLCVAGVSPVAVQAMAILLRQPKTRPLLA